MAELRKTGPYIWVTWLTKLLVGESSCEWAGWHRAHHIAGPRRTSVSLEQSGWLLDHTAAVQDCRAILEDERYDVTTENQNSFVLRGRTAALGGKPDLVGLKGRKRASSWTPRRASPGRPTSPRSCSICTPCPGPWSDSETWCSTARSPDPRGGHSGPDRGRRVHREGHGSDPAAGLGDAGPTCPERPGVPMVRGPGLPRASPGRAPGGRDGRLLTRVQGCGML